MTNNYFIVYKGDPVELITTKKAAEALGISPRRVLAMIQARQLPAQKIGRDYLILKADMKLVKVRKPGRPRKKPTR